MSSTSNNNVFQDFTGSVPKDARLTCLTSKRAHFNNMTQGQLTQTVREILVQDRAQEESQEATLDEILGIVQAIQQSNNVTPTQLSSAILYYSSLDFQRYDGVGNNLQNPSWAAADILLTRISGAYYDPATQVAVRGASNPNPRIVSNAICQGVSGPSARRLSDMAWAWGQFLDHEIDITHTQSAPEYPIPETLDITTPDVVTDPSELYPGRTIPFTRSVFKEVAGVRQQPNDITAYIDATNVYGFNSTRVLVLRRLDGTGKLKTTLSDNSEVIPPYNTEGLDNAAPAGSTASDFFLCGDVRANEQALLTAMHTLFIREHNYQCDQIVQSAPSFIGQDELIFQQARRIVMGEMQQITYREFLPALLGTNTGLETYSGYNESVNASMHSEVSTVTYRIGHTMVSANLALGPTAASSVALRDVFFTPSYLQTNGADALLIGSTKQISQEIDGILVEDLRSFLFGPPTVSLMHDLAALNLQRSRDHGIPGYNALRVAYGLPSIPDFASLPTSASNQTKLQSLYDSVDDIDPWIMAIAENHVSGASVGPLIYQSLIEQFDRLKRGDRYFFENMTALSDQQKQTIRNTTLRDILVRNTQYSASDFNSNVFFVP